MTKQDDTPTDRHWSDEIVLPALLGRARRTYGGAIRRALAEAGFDDMPRAGARVLGGIARHSAHVGGLAGEHGVSKQAASQLIDTLVLRGYVERIPDETDRRRTNVALTERGRAAAEAIRGAVEGVDAALEHEVGAEELARVRRTLAALVQLGGCGEHGPRGRGRGHHGRGRHGRGGHRCSGPAAADA